MLGFKLFRYRGIPVIVVPWLFYGVGLALPFCIITLTRSKRDIDDKVYIAHLEHERTHVKQWWRYWIVGFIILYAYYCIRYGYHHTRHGIEQEARDVEEYYLNVYLQNLNVLKNHINTYM